MVTKNPQIPKAGPVAPKPLAADKPIGLPQAGNDEDFEEDFTEVENGFPMAAEGMHHAKVIDFERAESRSGNPQYVWQLRITSGVSNGVELRYWTSLLPQARWKTAETLDAIGVEAAGSIARFSKKDVIGKPCVIEVIQETYDGKLNHKIRKVYPPDADSIAFAKSSGDVPF